MSAGICYLECFFMWFGSLLYIDAFRMPKRNASFVLLPESWSSEMQKSTDLELKLMSQRVQALKDPFRELANSLDKEWAKTFGSSGGFLSRFKENQRINGLSSRMESFATLAFRPSLTPFSSPPLPKPINKIAVWKVPSYHFDLPSFTKAVVQEFHHKEEEDYEGSSAELKIPIDLKEIRVALRKLGSQKGVSRWNKYVVGKWEPLRRLRVTLMELELVATASRTPPEFLDNLKKTEFFENTKRTLDRTVSDVAPLDVPELLESLIRQSEPLLDQLGVNKGFSEKICTAIRSWKHNDKLQINSSAAVKDVSILSKEAGRAADELDFRIANVLESTCYQYKGGFWGDHPPVGCLQHDEKQNVTIVTTASLPWMTGTAVNPLFRAAYLARHGNQKVTLLVPWLCKKDQELVYPNHVTFDSPEEQEAYIRQWLEGKVHFKADFKILFYPGKFSKERRSILAVDDITRFIPEKEADIAILEEPEHLTWYHHGARWTQRFRHVVGIVHTNYLEYAKREKNGPIQAFFLKHVNNWVTNIYCHKVVKLSAATQKFPKSIVCNVHGVSPKFLDIGQKIANQKVEGNPFNMEGAYYLGKMVWGKGYYELLDLLAKYKKDLHELKLDVFGTGEDSEAIKAEALKHNLAIKFYEGKDHADPSIYRYKVFINPSVSDVVCTTTAEALAMGKIVVCTDHPSNEFFNSFPNCWKYKNSEEFVQKVKQAMESEPLPLTEEQCYLLSWEAATDRFISSADLDSIHPKHVETCVQLSRKQIPPLLSMHRFINDGLFLAHYCLTGLEVARLATGAIPGTIHMDEEQCKDLGVASPLRQRAASRVW